MKKIFVWSDWLDDVLLGIKPPDGQGGAEVQMAMWANTFSTNGWQVGIYGRHSSAMRKHNNKLKVYWAPWARKIGVFFIFFKYLALIRFNPEFLLVRSPRHLKALLFFKKILRFKIIYMLTHDRNVEVNLSTSPKAWQKKLEQVEFVVVQNDYQKQKYLEQIEQREIILIPNIYDHQVIDITGIVVPSYDFLWVANFKKAKRPDLFIELSKKLPQYSFAMIGAPQDRAIYSECEKKAQSIENLYILGPKDIKSTTAFIAQSNVFVNTSENEGFPNTFLQAWNYSRPIIATVDPNKSISKYQVGRIFTTIDEGQKALHEVLTDHKLYRSYQENIELYYKKHHSSLTMMKHLETYILN